MSASRPDLRRKRVVDTDSRAPRFRQIERYILDQIERGMLAPGDRLPPLRPWAEEAGASYETIRKAVLALVARGVLETSPKRGTTVALPDPANHGTGTVGIVTTFALLDTLRSRYFRLALPILQDELMRRHARVVHERWTPGTPMRRLFSSLRLVHGMVVLGNSYLSAPDLRIVERAGVPTVILGGDMDAEDIWMVRSDDFAACRQAVTRLIAMGHRQIAAWSVRPDDPRARGYLQGLADAGLPARREFLFSGHRFNIVGALPALTPRPTALMVLSHMDRVGEVAQGLAAAGLRIGSDVFFCAYDDDLWGHLSALGVPYARIEQPVREHARLAAQVISDRIAGRPPPSPHTLLPARVIVVDRPAAPRTAAD
jgi:DNA-binding LacI/PurR family transcriptional regulator